MSEPAVIPTRRVLLRGWREEDRSPFAAMNADPLVMKHFPAPLSRADSDAFVDRIRAHFHTHGWGLWAAELRVSGEFIGFVGLNLTTFEAPFTPAVEIGWRLDHRHWNKGIATEAARGVVRHAFDDLGMDELVSFTSLPNLASRRVMEKLGMQRDPAEDFDHSKVEEGSPLRRHVLYRLASPGVDPVPSP
jgi:ribosomal-protein-alanine N-acetyltransferase